MGFRNRSFVIDRYLIPADWGIRNRTVVTSKIKHSSNWPIVERALSAASDGQPMPPSIFAAIADRLRSAIESPDPSRIDSTAMTLEALFRKVVAAAPNAVQTASRGEVADDTAVGYALGKLAFAQLFASRVADTRADYRFVEHVRDARYLPYLQALYAEPMSVTALAETANNRIETVSRKLAVLRALGIVSSRRHGTVVQNTLTPAARAILESLGLAPEQTEAVPVVKAPQVQRAIDDTHDSLAPYLQATPPFIGRRHQKRAA